MQAGQRRRSQAWRRVATLSVVVLVAVGCGGVDELHSAAEPVAPGRPGSPPTEVSSDRLDSIANVHGRVAATRSHLVTVGWTGPGSDETGPFGEALDLRSGSTTEIPSPDDSAIVQGSLGLDDSVVIFGAECDPAGQRFENDPDWCEDQGLSFRYDLASGEWHELDVPDGVDEMTSAQALPDGGAVATFRRLVGGHPTSTETVVVALLAEAGWQPIAEVRAGLAGTRWCASADAIHQLVIDPTGERETLVEGHQESTVRFALRSIGWDGTATTLAAPALDPFFSGAGVNLACAAEGPVLTSGGGLDEAVALHHLVDGQRWQEVPGGVSGARPASVGRVLSHAAGPAVAVWDSLSSEPQAVPDLTATSVTGAGDLTVVSEDVEDCALIWRGTSTDLLVIGPFGAVPAGKPVDFYESFDTVTLRTIEVPSS